jgi:hypothetical protein
VIDELEIDGERLSRDLLFTGFVIRAGRPSVAK